MSEELLLRTEVQSESETIDFSAKLVSFLKPGDTLFLYGNLGSGKTFIIRELVQLLGLNVNVSSPTFTIINRYNGQQNVNHIDLYRIQNADELNNIGLTDIWADDSINLVEWPQLLENMVNWRHYRLYIKFDPSRENWRCFILYRYE